MTDMLRENGDDMDRSELPLKLESFLVEVHRSQALSTPPRPLRRVGDNLNSLLSRTP
jgi:hypothetical protein